LKSFPQEADLISQGPHSSTLAVSVTSRFERIDLRLTGDALGVGHIHDRIPEDSVKSGQAAWTPVSRG
jgi:hypothetical protein